LAECAANSTSTVQEELNFFTSVVSTVPGATTKISNSPKESERIWSIRKRAYFASMDLRKLTNGKLRVITTDVAVPVSRLVDILHWTKEYLKKTNLIAPIVAHAGDGNFHTLLLVSC
jgi:D-lactate dehydrogenase (cytochrome)